MSFVDRLVRISQEKKSKITPIEGTALAAEHLELAWTEETSLISWPRASSLYSCCMRQMVLGYQLQRSKSAHLSFRDKLLYGIGSAIHVWVQDSGDVLGDRRRGWWFCRACQRILYFGGPPKKRCNFCGAHQEAIVYREHSLRIADPVMLTGHPDMFVEPRKSVFRVTEIKTITGKEFDTLVGVRIQDEWQLQAYMWGCSIDKKLPVKVDPSLGYVMYISKRAMVKGLPVKMYTVPQNPMLLSRIMKKLELFKAGVKGYPENVPGPDDSCVRAGMDNYQASTCPVREECVRIGIDE